MLTPPARNIADLGRGALRDPNLEASHLPATQKGTHVVGRRVATRTDLGETAGDRSLVLIVELNINLLVHENCQLRALGKLRPSDDLAFENLGADGTHDHSVAWEMLFTGPVSLSSIPVAAQGAG